MDDVASALWFHRDHLQQMREHVMASLPEEACGIVGGQEGRSVQVFPVENALHSPVRYQMNPEKQVEVLVFLENKGWDLMAIYHSHPNGPDRPSPTDIAEAYYPEAAHLIWFRAAGEWQCRAFRILDKTVVELQIRSE